MGLLLLSDGVTYSASYTICIRRSIDVATNLCYRGLAYRSAADSALVSKRNQRVSDDMKTEKENEYGIIGNLGIERAI